MINLYKVIIVSDTRMEVQIVGDVGFVWDLNTVLLLRNKYRILGSFVGFSPKSVDIGLPLQLLGEEVQLLKEKGIIKLVELKCLEEEPSDKLIQRFVTCTLLSTLNSFTSELLNTRSRAISHRLRSSRRREWR